LVIVLEILHVDYPDVVAVEYHRFEMRDLHPSLHSWKKYVTKGRNKSTDEPIVVITRKSTFETVANGGDINEPDLGSI